MAKQIDYFEIAKALARIQAREILHLPRSKDLGDREDYGAQKMQEEREWYGSRERAERW